MGGNPVAGAGVGIERRHFCNTDGYRRLSFRAGAGNGVGEHGDIAAGIDGAAFRAAHPRVAGHGCLRDGRGGCAGEHTDGGAAAGGCHLRHRALAGSSVVIGFHHDIRRAHRSADVEIRLLHDLLIRVDHIHGQIRHSDAERRLAHGCISRGAAVDPHIDISDDDGPAAAHHRRFGVGFGIGA